MNFSHLQYNPVFSKISTNSDANDFSIWYEDVFLKQSLLIRISVGSERAKEEVKEICDQLGISDWQKIGYVARIFRDIFCENISESEIKKRLEKQVSLRPHQINEIYGLIEKAIEEIKKAGKKEYDENFEKISLEEMLKKYPEIQEQIISDEGIINEEDGYLMAGTIKNWLVHYFQKAGGHKHNSLERSDYLFNLEEVKILDEKEKEKLEIILKAFDENSLVTVNKKTKEIDFRESRQEENDFNKKRKELNGIIKQYDTDLDLKNRKAFKKQENQGFNFKKIENTPNFEVDEEKRNENNPIKLREKEVVDKKNRNDFSGNRRKIKNISNVLDLSDYL